MIIDRRSVMAAAGFPLIAAPLIRAVVPTIPASAKSTFVLVHGTWLGGWIWANVAERLRRDGHRVFTPTDRRRRTPSPCPP